LPWAITREPASCSSGVRAIVRSQGREDAPENATLHYNCGRVRLNAGDYAAAEQEFLTARQLAAADSGSRGARNLSLHALAYLYARTGRAAEALPLTSEAIEIENAGLWRILSVSTDTQRRSQIERLTLTTNILLSLVLRFFADDQVAVGAALAVVLNRKHWQPRRSLRHARSPVRVTRTRRSNCMRCGSFSRPSPSGPLLARAPSTTRCWRI
jgi:tetratricopeptide (TPR) repeat protein